MFRVKSQNIINRGGRETFMLSGIRKYLVGELDNKKLKEQIHQSEQSVIRMDFGKLGGRVYFVKPRPEQDLNQELAKLDSQIESRKPMEAIKYLADGPFLLTRTDEFVRENHHIYMSSLHRPLIYMQAVMEAVNDELQHDKSLSIADIAIKCFQRGMVKALFEVDEFPPDLLLGLENLTKTNKERKDGFSYGVLVVLASSYYSWILPWIRSIKMTRENYTMSAKEFLLAQSERVSQDLKSYANHQPVHNIISLSVIELIKEHNPELKTKRADLDTYLNEMDKRKLEEYLLHSYIRTLPFSLMAGDNAIEVIANCLSILTKNPDELEKLNEVIKEYKLDAEFTAENCKRMIEAEQHKGGYFHRFYLEALRRGTLEKSIDELAFEQMLFRYTTDPVEIDGQSIEANSMIFFLNSYRLFDNKCWNDPGAFNPARFFNQEKEGVDPRLARIIEMGNFSSGPRNCPGNKIVKYIVMTMIAYIAVNHSEVLKREVSPNYQLTAR